MMTEGGASQHPIVGLSKVEKNRQAMQSQIAYEYSVLVSGQHHEKRCKLQAVRTSGVIDLRISPWQCVDCTHPGPDLAYMPYKLASLVNSEIAYEGPQLADAAAWWAVTRAGVVPE